MFAVQFFNHALLTVLMNDLHYSFNISAHKCTALEHRGMYTNTDNSKTSFDFHGM